MIVMFFCVFSKRSDYFSDMCTQNESGCGERRHSPVDFDGFISFFSFLRFFVFSGIFRPLRAKMGLFFSYETKQSNVQSKVNGQPM